MCEERETLYRLEQFCRQGLQAEFEERLLNAHPLQLTCLSYREIPPDRKLRNRQTPPDAEPASEGTPPDTEPASEGTPPDTERTAEQDLFRTKRTKIAYLMERWLTEQGKKLRDPPQSVWESENDEDLLRALVELHPQAAADLGLIEARLQGTDEQADSTSGSQQGNLNQYFTLSRALWLMASRDRLGVIHEEDEALEESDLARVVNVRLLPWAVCWRNAVVSVGKAYFEPGRKATIGHVTVHDDPYLRWVQGSAYVEKHGNKYTDRLAGQVTNAIKRINKRMKDEGLFDYEIRHRTARGKYQEYPIGDRIPVRFGKAQRKNPRGPGSNRQGKGDGTGDADGGNGSGEPRCDQYSESEIRSQARRSPYEPADDDFVKHCSTCEPCSELYMSLLAEYDDELVELELALEGEPDEQEKPDPLTATEEQAREGPPRRIVAWEPAMWLAAAAVGVCLLVVGGWQLATHFPEVARAAYAVFFTGGRSPGVTACSRREVEPSLKHARKACTSGIKGRECRRAISMLCSALHGVGPYARCRELAADEEVDQAALEEFFGKVDECCGRQ